NKGYDLVGQTFGFLTVLKDTGERDPRKGKLWLCQCSCGKSKTASTVHLKRGNTKSCGCLVRIRAEERRKANTKHSVSTKPVSRTKQRKAKRKPKVVIPAELENVPSAFVQDGLFRVFENGRIFRYTKRGVSEAKVHTTNGYRVVSASVDGVQKHFY